MGAVQNAMQRDGDDPAIMDLDHNKSVASQMKKADDGPPLKEDPKYMCVSFSCYVFHINFVNISFTVLPSST